MVQRALFSALYFVYSTVICKYFIYLFSFIDFLEVTKYRIPNIKNTDVHENVMHLYALQFLVLYNLFPLCITAILI